MSFQLVLIRTFVKKLIIKLYENCNSYVAYAQMCSSHKHFVKLKIKKLIKLNCVARLLFAFLFNRMYIIEHVIMTNLKSCRIRKFLHA